MTPNLCEKLKNASMVAFGMSNGHVIFGKWKSCIDQHFWVVEEHDSMCETFLVENEICYIKFVHEAKLPCKGSSNASEKGIQFQLQGCQEQENQSDGAYSEAIKKAKKKFRSSEFTIRHPKSDGMDPNRPLFKPKIEMSRKANDIDQED